jgi:hypothetical protein
MFGFLPAKSDGPCRCQASASPGFPASELGNKRLAVERRVLRLVAARCSYQAPRILFVSACGFDVRQMVPGRCDPWDLFHRCKADWRLAQRIGRSIGAILAEQHTKIVEVDVAGWLPQCVAWPEASHWMRERLPQVVNDHALLGVIEQVVERYEAVLVGVKDLATDAVNGIFDYDSAAWADRHHDFRYLLFDVDRRHAGFRP